MGVRGARRDHRRARRALAPVLATLWAVATLGVPALHLVGHEDDHVHLPSGGLLFVDAPAPEHTPPEHAHHDAHAHHEDTQHDADAHPEHAHPAHAQHDAHAHPAHAHNEHAHPEHAHAPHDDADDAHAGAARAHRDAPDDDAPPVPRPDASPRPLSFHGAGSAAHFGAALISRAAPLVVEGPSVVGAHAPARATDDHPRPKLVTPGCRSRAPPRGAPCTVERAVFDRV